MNFQWLLVLDMVQLFSLWFFFSDLRNNSLTTLPGHVFDEIDNDWR